MGQLVQDGGEERRTIRLAIQQRAEGRRSLLGDVIERAKGRGVKSASHAAHKLRTVDWRPACARKRSTSVVLPMPASPLTSAIRPWPVTTASSRL